jgi:alpha-tubulin suppressor-like RCC1 family protein
MCSKLQHIPLPGDKKCPDSEIEQISTGSTISATLLSKGGGLYFWGSGNGSQYRTPLPMKVMIAMLHDYLITNKPCLLF